MVPGRRERTGTDHLLALVVCPETAQRIAHLAHPCSGNAVKEAADTYTTIAVRNSKSVDGSTWDETKWVGVLGGRGRGNGAWGEGLTGGAHGLFYGFYHPLVARGLQAHFGKIQRAGCGEEG